MLFTCGISCSNPLHSHGRRSAALAAGSRKATTAIKPKAKKPTATSALVVDVHCHHFNTSVAQKAAVIDPMQHEFTHIFSNDLTREVNFKQVRDRAPQLSDIPTRIRDMDKMGVDVQVVSPAPFQYYYFAEPDFGLELSKSVNDGIQMLSHSFLSALWAWVPFPFKTPNLPLRNSRGRLTFWG